MGAPGDHWGHGGLTLTPGGLTTVTGERGAPATENTSEHLPAVCLVQFKSDAEAASEDFKPEIEYVVKHHHHGGLFQFRIQ